MTSTLRRCVPLIAHRVFARTAAATTLAMLAACAQPAPTKPSTDSHVMPSPEPRNIQSLDEQVLADAKRRAQAPSSGTSTTAPIEENAAIRSKQAVTWRDGALGCPQPGMMYTQALVPGWRIEVQVGQQTFIYHATRQGRWLHCPADRAQKPLPAQDDHTI